MTRVFMDIETLPPDEERLKSLDPKRVRRLLKKRGKQDDDDCEGCTEEEVRSLSLHAEYGRVLSIAVIVEQDDGSILHRGVLGRDRETRLFHCDEPRVLRAFWALMATFDVSRDVIVGHNVFWDVKFLRKRSLVNRIRPTIHLSFARYRCQPIYDTQQEWCTWDYGQYIKLDDLADVLGVGFGKTEGMDGARVYDEYLAGNHEKIAEYNLRDVELVRAIYYRMVAPEAEVPGPETEACAAAPAGR